MTSKVIDLEGLRRFKELLDAANAEKFADKEQFTTLATAFEEQYQIASDEQINSMLDEIFG